jgi:O-antigen/teichoic acid export membrane protein
VDVLETERPPINGAGEKLAWLGKGSLAVLDQGLISGSNFLIGIVLARWLVPEQFGAYALAFSIFLFLAGFQNALFLEPMSVFGPASHRKCLQSYLGSLLGLNFILTIFLSILLCTGTIVLRPFSTNHALTPALFGVCVGIPLILSFWLCRRAVYLELAPGLAASSASAYCLVLISLLLVVRRLGWLSSFTAFVIQSIAALAAAVFLLIFLKPQFDSRTGPATSAIVGQHWRYGRWSMGTVFVYWLSGNAYYVVIGALLRMKDVAALRALQNFTLPFGQLLTALSLLVLPWASARFAEEGRLGLQQRIRQITIMFTGGACAYLAVIWLFGGRLIGVLYDGRYTEFAYLLPLVAAPMVITAASQGSSIAVLAMQFPADVFLAYAVAGIATVLIGVPLTRYYGLTGAALGILISSLAFFTAITFRCRARLKVAHDETASAS